MRGAWEIKRRDVFERGPGQIKGLSWDTVKQTYTTPR